MEESIHRKSALNQVSARVVFILEPSSRSFDSPQLAVLTSFKSIDNGSGLSQAGQVNYLLAVPSTLGL